MLITFHRVHHLNSGLFNDNWNSTCEIELDLVETSLFDRGQTTVQVPSKKPGSFHP